MGYSLVFASVVLGAAGQILFRLGMRSAAPTLASNLAAMFSLPVLAGLGCYALSTVFWLHSLTRLPLSLAYPFFGLNFITVPLAASLLLGEPLTPTRLAGALVILAGIWMAAR